MQHCLDKQIGRNVHVCVDDIAVMSKKQDDLITDLSETIANLREYQMKNNPAKCVFGVPASKLLGFIVSQRGIEIDPKKIKAIQNIEGSATAVSQFISRLGDKAFPLYKLLKKSDNFVWSEEAEAALA